MHALIYTISSYDYTAYRGEFYGDGVLFIYNKKKTELLCCPADYYPLKLVIPNGVKYIHSDAFSGCNNLREVIIPDSVECIGFNAFTGCRHLKSVRLPSSIYLEDDTFMWCVELEELINSENMVGISPNALDLCFSLKKLRLGEIVREGCISESSFGCPNLEEIEVDPINPDFSSKDGVLYNKDKTVLLFCPYLAYDSVNGTVRIPNEEIKKEFSKAVKEVKHQENLDRLRESEQLFANTIEKRKSSCCSN